MKPKLKHMKINTQSRKDYVKAESKKEKIKQYKKQLMNWLVTYSRVDVEFYCHVIVLSKEEMHKDLSSFIRLHWTKHNPKIVANQTGFIDNIQYLESIVDNLKQEIPPPSSDSEDSEEEYHSPDEVHVKEEDAKPKKVSNSEFSSNKRDGENTFEESIRSKKAKVTN